MKCKQVALHIAKFAFKLNKRIDVLKNQQFY